MRAKYILLNHFSQRYPKLPKLPMPTSVVPVVETPPTESINAEPNAIFGENATFSASSTSLQVSTEPIVSISFDFMSLRLGDMWKMPYYMEGLSMLFAEPEDGEDVVNAVQTTEGTGVDGKEGNEKGGNQGKGDGKEKTVANVSWGGGNNASPVVAKPASKSKRSLKKEAARAVKAKAEEERAAASVSGIMVGGIQKEEKKEKRGGSPGLEGPDRKRRSTGIEESGVEAA